MKIIHVTAAYKPAYVYGGPTMSVAKLCEEIAKNEDSFNLEVFTTTANGKNELSIQPNSRQTVDSVPVTYFKRITKDHTHFSPSLLKHLRNEILKSIEKKEILIIHVHAWWNLVSVLSCLLAKVYRIPLVLSPRGMLTPYTNQNNHTFSKKLLHQLIGRSLLKYCHVHATSEQERHEILQIIKPKSISIISNLVSLGASKVEASKTNDAFRLIFLSRVEQKKGLSLLFEALSNLKNDWFLTIAGSGEQAYIETLKEYAQSLKIDNRIKWIGHVKNEDKFDLLAQHDLMVLTSQNENFANVVVESLSVGTAVLLSNKVGLSTYVAKKDLGWIANLDHGNILSKLNESFLDGAKRQRIRASGLSIIEQDFNDQILAKSYFKLYKNLADGRL